ncbi:MAG: 2-C-methyl-D-erythritol 4-phosphate cytidylyltransferase [Christensenellales bacterium]|jgi:2-C-methyl-D-erythritol 4-phosphate cytidylyltransferase
MNIAIVLSGGKGERMAADVPKQYMELCGRPVIMHALAAFDAHPDIDGICVVLRDDWADSVLDWAKRFNINKIRWIAKAGQSRTASSLSGINAIKADCSDNDIVIIHDAARPLVSERIISDGINAAMLHGAANTVIPCVDTVVLSKGGEFITGLPSREGLYMVQTPQCFKYSIISDAYSQHEKSGGGEVSDDCTLVVRAGYGVALSPGERSNIKITSKGDIELAAALMAIRNLV